MLLQVSLMPAAVPLIVDTGYTISVIVRCWCGWQPVLTAAAAAAAAVGAVHYQYTSGLH